MSDYQTLFNGGFSYDEIQNYLHPKLASAGFADQEISEYFNKHQNINGIGIYQDKALGALPNKLSSEGEQIPVPAGSYDVYSFTPEGYTSKDPPINNNGGNVSEPKLSVPGLSDFFMHGAQGSVTGLWLREKLPEAVSPEDLEKSGFADRLAMGLGSFAGDLPTILAGGVMGTSGGAAAPVTIPAGAMALTEGIRASYIDRIKSGKVDDFFYMGGTGETLSSAGKGAVIGAGAGGAGMLAGRGAVALGGSAGIGNIAAAGAEVGAIPTIAAGMEGRLPAPHEFVDAALFIGALRGVHNIKSVPELTPKLRDIYVKIGKTPLEVAEAAKNDQTVVQDILSCNRKIPGAFKGTETISKEQIEKLVSILDTGEYKDVNFGTLREDYKAALNEIRTEKGQPLIADDNLIIPANVVKKLHEKRVLQDGMNTNNVAKLLLDIFHADADLASSTRYDHTQALIRLRDELADIGFISINPGNGQTVIKSVYTERTGRMEQRLGGK